MSKNLYKALMIAGVMLSMLTTHQIVGLDLAHNMVHAQEALQGANALEMNALEMGDQIQRVRQEQHQRRIAELTRKANDPSVPAWQRDAARQALVEEDARYLRARNKREEFEDQLAQLGLNLAHQAAQGREVVQAMQLRIARDREEIQRVRQIIHELNEEEIEEPTSNVWWILPFIEFEGNNE